LRRRTLRYLTSPESAFTSRDKGVSEQRYAGLRCEGVEPAIGIGLKNPAIVGKMPGGMDAGPPGVARFRSLSALWPGRAEITLGAENITVKACDPPPSAGGNVQVPNSGLYMRGNSFPIKLRVEFREIGR
jgi:hypothetical protein